MNRAARRAALAGGRRKVAIADNGKPMAVLRPRDPDVAIELAKLANVRNDGTGFQRIIDREPKGMEFVGWLEADGAGWVLDDDRKRVGRLQPGDSFVTHETARPKGWTS